MGTNPYLEMRAKEYDSLSNSIESIQLRAKDANRALTDDELKTVREMSEQGKTLAAEIETLTDAELRSASVRDMNAKVAAALRGADGAGNQGGAAGTGDDVQLRHAGQGGAQTRDRDPGHYRSVQQGGRHSFFGDIYAARDRGDADAAQRLAEHNRALSTGSAGAGVVAPKWLLDEFAPLARQGRMLADAVRNIPLGDDPRPLTLPKQTTGADAEVTEQANENDAVEDDDAWGSSVDTVTPKPTAGIQIVSRQMLDMSSPAIDGLIYGDLIAAYNLKIEKKIGSAIIAVGTALPASESGTDEVLVTEAAHYARVFIKAAIAVRNARKLPATLAAMSVNRWGSFLDLTDTTGRPLVTGQNDGPSNVMGVANVSELSGGRYKGVTLAPTDGIALDDRYALVRAADVLLFESNMMRFRYEQPLGPESVKMGIWAYSAVLIRYGTAAVKRVEITVDNTP